MLYYPNACTICQCRENLKQCGRCHMISYCGVDHQKEDWPRHKEICSLILKIAKEKNRSHIFEGLRGADSKKWFQERGTILFLIKATLTRPIKTAERRMFTLPRACFVCHDIRQQLLKNCPGCPFASFCEQHPSSSLHDKDCFSLSYSFQLDMKFNILNKSMEAEMRRTIIKTRQAAPILINLKPPESMKEYLFDYIKPKGDLSADARVSASEYCSASLSLFGALRKLNYNPGSKLVVHLNSYTSADRDNWEIILHLLPRLATLTIVIFEQEEEFRVQLLLCSKCSRKNRRLIMVSNEISYESYKQETYYMKPDFYMWLQASLVMYEKSDLYWDSLVDLVGSCPVVITTESKKELNNLKKKLVHRYLDSPIFFDGFNEFGSLRPNVDMVDGRVKKYNQFIIIIKDSSSDSRTKAKVSAAVESKRKSVKGRSSKCRKEPEFKNKNLKCRIGSTDDDDDDDDDLIKEMKLVMLENLTLKKKNKELKDEELNLQEENKLFKAKNRRIKSILREKERMEEAN